MRLDDKGRKILGAAELQATAPVSRLRKETGLKEHTIRYYLSRCRDEGIIRRRVFLNVYPLGFTDFAIYFSVATHSRKTLDALITHLASSECVSWLSQLGGDYQYGFSICARSISEVTSYLDQLSERFSEVFFEKSLSIRLSLTRYSRKYLQSGTAKPRKLSFGDEGHSVELDDKDRQILALLSKNEFQSEREIARLLGWPHATVEKRIKALERNKIIKGYIYEIDSTKLGMSRYTLLVYVKGLKRQLGERLKSFAEKHRQVTHFVECLGSWDYEVGAEVEKAEQIMQLTQELYTEFGTEVNTIRVLPVFGYPKVSNYPFR